MDTVVNMYWYKGAWGNSRKEIYTGKNVAHYYWITNAWIKSADEVYIHDPNNIVTDYAYKHYFENNTDDKIFFGDSTHFYIPNEPNGIAKYSKVPDEITIYPNPSSGKFTVEFENNHSIKKLEVYNCWGEKMLEQTSGEVVLNKIAKGVYLLKVFDEEKVYHKKIALE